MPSGPSATWRHKRTVAAVCYASSNFCSATVCTSTEIEYKSWSVRDVRWESNDIHELCYNSCLFMNLAPGAHYFRRAWAHIVALSVDFQTSLTMGHMTGRMPTFCRGTPQPFWQQAYNLSFVSPNPVTIQYLPINLTWASGRPNPAK